MKQIFAFSFLVLFAVGCKKFETFNGFTQGTTYHIIYEKKGLFSISPEKMKREVDSLLVKFDLSLSSYVPQSIISRMNNNDPDVVADHYFIDVFNESQEVWMDTDGAFDITVGPLVNAWGFGPEGKEDMDSVKVDSLLRFVGMDKVHLEGNKLLKDLPEMKLDVNAIAQGYSVDVVCEFLEDKGIKNYLVEIGGELRTNGTKKNGEPWKVGVDKPFDYNFIPGENLQVVLQLRDCSMATSGNYRKFFEKDGIKYSHSIDPKSGYPVMDRLLSATIVAKDCMTADAYATACMIMGLEKSIVFISGKEGLDAYFIYSADNGVFKTWETWNFEKLIYKEDNNLPL
jgi:thiamine biosynthesis lipoprotein